MVGEVRCMDVLFLSPIMACSLLVVVFYIKATGPCQLKACLGPLLWETQTCCTCWPPLGFSLATGSGVNMLQSKSVLGKKQLCIYSTRMRIKLHTSTRQLAIDHDKTTMIMMAYDDDASEVIRTINSILW